MNWSIDAIVRLVGGEFPQAAEAGAALAAADPAGQHARSDLSAGPSSVLV